MVVHGRCPVRGGTLDRSVAGLLGPRAFSRASTTMPSCSAASSNLKQTCCAECALLTGRHRGCQALFLRHRCAACCSVGTARHGLGTAKALIKGLTYFGPAARVPGCS